tara:strand:- start:169 stop:795 length:627 start_codon:yes stop_codon:yes gene_type:complete
MKISYAIPVHNEYKELKHLLNYLYNYKRPEDEIVIQCDKGNTTPEVYKVLDEYSKLNMSYKHVEFSLNSDFATFKNNLKDNCTGDYIFQIDADEYPEEYLMSTLPTIIKDNNKVDIFWVPRINLVEGLTTNHVKRWGWVMNNGNRVNFPDYQCRILKNVKRIKWKNKVHEVLTGYKTESKLPINDEFCLHHPKTIERQEAQNKFYNTL